MFRNKDIASGLLKKLCLPLLIFSLCLPACKAPSKRQDFSISSSQMELMQKALSLMKQSQFLKAGEIYDQLSLSLKGKDTLILMLFNAGVAYKEAGWCQKSIYRFQKLLDHSLKRMDFKARGLMELSLVHECLAQLDQALIALKDLEPLRDSHLPLFLSQAVYPARLAILHAGAGQSLEAEKYQSQALSAVVELGRTFPSQKVMNQEMVRVLYLMGKSYVKKERMEPEAFLRSFPHHHFFLIQALLLKNQTEQIQQELALLFDKLNFALSSSSQRKGKSSQWKKQSLHLKRAILAGQSLLKKEQLTNIESFYLEKSRPVLKLLDHQP